MSETSDEDRKHAVQAVTERNAIQRRINHTQKQLRALQDIVQDIVQDIAAREALLQSLAADQAALIEKIKLIDEFKAKMRQEEERIRRKTQEALRLKAEWQNSQMWRNNHLPFFSSGSVPPSDGQTFGLMAIAFAALLVIGLLLRLR